MGSTHEERIRDAFTQQAATFERADLNVAFTSGLPWLLALADPQASDDVLDVAGGTGLVARSLAGQLNSATVVDSTPAMLDAGRRAASEEGHDNVDFVEGDARALPFPDGTFSLVVTRFSLHHFADPGPVLDEVVRVTSSGGKVVVKDLVAGAGPQLASRQDAIEILRDDSHVRMPIAGAIGRWLADRGCSVVQVEEKEIDRPLEPWLEQSVTPTDRAEEVRRRFRSELAGGEPTGMRPHWQDGELWFHQTWEATVATTA